MFTLELAVDRRLVGLGAALMALLDAGAGKQPGLQNCICIVFRQRSGQIVSRTVEGAAPIGRTISPIGIPRPTSS
ncbi:hypothetical protein ACFIOY_19255 [Bradyrhizobium sp. TZ2]